MLRGQGLGRTGTKCGLLCSEPELEFALEFRRPSECPYQSQDSATGGHSRHNLGTISYDITCSPACFLKQKNNYFGKLSLIVDQLMFPLL